MPKRILSIEDRFWSKVNIGSSDECWLWQKHVINSGYGLYSISHEVHILAHRMAWMITNGEIPSGYEVSHKCANRLCVNPEHLYLSSHAQNLNEVRLRKIRNKSKDGIVICPFCQRIIDEEQQALLTNMTRTVN